MVKKEVRRVIKKTKKRRFEKKTLHSKSTSGLFSHPVSDKELKEEMESDPSVPRPTTREERTEAPEDDDNDDEEESSSKSMKMSKKKYEFDLRSKKSTSSKSSSKSDQDIFDMADDDVISLHGLKDSDFYDHFDEEFDALEKFKPTDFDFESSRLSRYEMISRLHRLIKICRAHYRLGRNVVLLKRLVRIHKMLTYLSRGHLGYHYLHHDETPLNINRMIVSELGMLHHHIHHHYHHVYNLADFHDNLADARDQLLDLHDDSMAHVNDMNEDLEIEHRHHHSSYHRFDLSEHQQQHLRTRLLTGHYSSLYNHDDDVEDL